MSNESPWVERGQRGWFEPFPLDAFVEVQDSEGNSLAGFANQFDWELYTDGRPRIERYRVVTKPDPNVQIMTGSQDADEVMAQARAERALAAALLPETVNHPKHYNSHPSGIECITVAEHMGFNVGNAIKYLWRADEKSNALEDLRKAAWYINREIERRTRDLPATTERTS